MRASPKREPIVFRFRARLSSHPVRSETTASVMAASKRSSGPGLTCSQMHPGMTTMNTRASRKTPVAPIDLGSGGGAPVGRRWRLTTLLTSTTSSLFDTRAR